MIQRRTTRAKSLKLAKHGTYFNKFLEPIQTDLLAQICAGPLIPEEEFKAAGALDIPERKSKAKEPQELPLFSA
jgi:hypothetical protein